jgi:hypothetical protein
MHRRFTSSSRQCRPHHWLASYYAVALNRRQLPPLIALQRFFTFHQTPYAPGSHQKPPASCRPFPRIPPATGRAYPSRLSRRLLRSSPSQRCHQSHPFRLCLQFRRFRRSRGRRLGVRCSLQPGATSPRSPQSHRSHRLHPLHPICHSSINIIIFSIRRVMSIRIIRGTRVNSIHSIHKIQSTRSPHSIHNICSICWSIEISNLHRSGRHRTTRAVRARSPTNTGPRPCRATCCTPSDLLSRGTTVVLVRLTHCSHCPLLSPRSNMGSKSSPLLSIFHVRKLCEPNRCCTRL